MTVPESGCLPAISGQPEVGTVIHYRLRRRIPIAKGNQPLQAISRNPLDLSKQSYAANWNPLGHQNVSVSKKHRVVRMDKFAGDEIGAGMVP